MSRGLTPAQMTFQYQFRVRPVMALRSLSNLFGRWGESLDYPCCWGEGASAFISLWSQEDAVLSTIDDLLRSLSGTSWGEGEGRGWRGERAEAAAEQWSKAMNHPIVRGTSEEIFPVLPSEEGAGVDQGAAPSGGRKKQQCRTFIKPAINPGEGGAQALPPLLCPGISDSILHIKMPPEGESLLYPGTRAGLLGQRGEPNPGAKHFGPEQRSPKVAARRHRCDGHRVCGLCLFLPFKRSLFLKFSNSATASILPWV